MRMLGAVVACAVLASATPAQANEVKGIIRYAGKAPAAPPLPATKDQGVCGDSVPDESLVVTNGLLANAVVSVAGPVAGLQLVPTKVVLDQKKCRFMPRVLTAPVGSTVEIVNSDDLLHNAHGWSGKATVFNVPMPDAGQRAPKPLKKAGLVRVGCDVHAWMAAWILVADGPAAVSAQDGSYRLAGLPPGKYTVKVWHEKLGERSADVTVPASGDARLDVEFPAR